MLVAVYILFFYYVGCWKGAVNVIGFMHALAAFLFSLVYISIHISIPVSAVLNIPS